jgi:hypothetical protein
LKIAVFTLVVIVLSSMYSPVLDCVEVAPQPAASSTEAAMKTAKNRLAKTMLVLPMFDCWMTKG